MTTIITKTCLNHEKWEEEEKAYAILPMLTYANPEIREPGPV